MPVFSALQISKKLKFESSDIGWSSTAWFCAKSLKHYSGFDRKGTTIYVSKQFVLLLHVSHFLTLINSLIKCL